jgi:ATP-dependent exoDNAse (exonuclease V) alpha subunit
VEESEKTKDSRLAREFVVALPVELGQEEWKSLLTEFIQEQFVSDGMCADVCIHDTDGHNPHAHIMLTVRPLDERGKWQYKTDKEYLCIRNGGSGDSLPTSLRRPNMKVGKGNTRTRWAKRRST